MSSKDETLDKSESESTPKLSLEDIPDVVRERYEREIRIREKAAEALKDKVYSQDELLRTKCVPTVTPLGVLWALLSLMVAGTCSFSFLQPFWFTHPDKMDSLGIFTYCIRDPTAHAVPLRQVCGIYGGDFHFSNLPSHAWQATCVLYGGGCTFLCITSILAIVTLLMPHYCDKRLAIFCGYLQTLSGKVIHHITHIWVQILTFQGTNLVFLILRIEGKYWLFYTDFNI